MTVSIYRSSALLKNTKIIWFFCLHLLKTDDLMVSVTDYYTVFAFHSLALEMTRVTSYTESVTFQLQKHPVFLKKCQQVYMA